MKLKEITSLFEENIIVYDLVTKTSHFGLAWSMSNTLLNATVVRIIHTKHVTQVEVRR